MIGGQEWQKQPISSKYGHLRLVNSNSFILFSNLNLGIYLFVEKVASPECGGAACGNIEESKSVFLYLPSFA